MREKLSRVTVGVNQECVRIVLKVRRFWQNVPITFMGFRYYVFLIQISKSIVVRIVQSKALGVVRINVDRLKFNVHVPVVDFDFIIVLFF